MTAYSEWVLNLGDFSPSRRLFYSPLSIADEHPPHSRHQWLERLLRNGGHTAVRHHQGLRHRPHHAVLHIGTVVPKRFDRALWQGESAERDAEHRMMERIESCGKDSVAQYERPDIAPSKIAELKRILATAEARILGAAN